MNKVYTKKKHPKGFSYATVALDNNRIFIREIGVWPDPDRFGRTFDYGVYLYIDTSKEGWVILPGMTFPIKGQLIYIGRGVYDPSLILESRALNHINDELCKHLNENICAFLMGYGMTYEESSALEAFWIMKSGLNLTKRGKNWDGKGLINKKQERRWIEKGKLILKLYGDNTRFTA